MEYRNNGLTFNVLREANEKRLPQFKNKQREVCHSEDGSDWCLAQWSNACLGELGEAANIIKKIDRRDFTLEEGREALAKELADTVTYLNKQEKRAGIDLGKATIDKFNEISERVGSTVFIHEDGSDYYFKNQAIQL